MTYTLYIGSYTQDHPGTAGETHRPDGIFIYTMDPATGRLERAVAVESGPNPSFLALRPDGKSLYAVNELPESKASAFAIDAQGGLTLLNRQETGGTDACYTSVDPSGRWLMVANYTSGSLAVFPIQTDGSLGERAEFIQHHGSSVNASRQEAAHAHSIRFDPSGKFVIAIDLGIDRVLVYKLDMQTGRLTPHDPAGVDAAPGAGPRHPEFHPNGRILYVANELDSTVVVYAWDASSGRLSALQTCSTLPEGWSGHNQVADIHITPSGEFLYISNRGHDSLAAYRVDPASGELTALGVFASGGSWPRNFAIDPRGRFLLAANERGGGLVVFRINADGTLAPTGEQADIAQPVCVRIVEA